MFNQPFCCSFQTYLLVLTSKHPEIKPAKHVNEKKSFTNKNPESKQKCYQQQSYSNS